MKTLNHRGGWLGACEKAAWSGVVLAWMAITAPALAQMPLFELDLMGNAGDEATVQIVNPGPGFDSVTLTRGSDLTAAALPNGFGASGWAEGGPSEFSYIQIDVVGSAGVTYDFTSIEVQTYNGGMIDAATWELREVELLDRWSHYYWIFDPEIGDYIHQEVLSHTVNIQPEEWSGPRTGTTTFRLYGFCYSTVTGTSGLISTSPALSFYGTVPEPATSAVMVGGLLLGLAVWRRARRG